MFVNQLFMETVIFTTVLCTNWSRSSRWQTFKLVDMEQEKSVTADDIQIDLFGNGSHNRLRSHAHRHSIRCFKHCSKFVFCFELPDTCPVCESSLLTSEIRVPNFIYPSPLEHEHTSCSAILVRPSQGKSFLHDYGNGDDLHCGLLDEEGKETREYTASIRCDSCTDNGPSFTYSTVIEFSPLFM